MYAERAAVVFPEGAVTSPLGVTVSTPKKSDLMEIRRQAAVESRKGLVAASGGVQYGPEGSHFAKPVTLELPYDRAALPAGVSESDLAVHYWIPALGDWEKLASSVDSRNQIVRAQTSHFSLYQIFGGGSAASAPASPNDPTFAVHAGYDFPKLLTGSMGTLGVIEHMTLKVRPRPEASAVAWVGFDGLSDVSAALDLSILLKTVRRVFQSDSYLRSRRQ